MKSSRRQPLPQPTCRGGPRVRPLVVLSCLLVILLLPTGCKKQDASLSQVQRAGVLRVGIDPSWPPFESVDAASGELVGLDVDLARAIGSKLGVQVSFVYSGWEGLYEALAAGQFDAILSALPYDEWRTQEAAYSISYFNAGPVIAVAADQAAVSRAKDLAGRAVHVELGSEGDVQARRLRRKIDLQEIVTHTSAQEALTALRDDPNGAAIVDAVSARLFIREPGGLRIVGEPLYDELYVVAVSVRAQSLRQAIDATLIEMRESGELAALLDRWL